MIKKGEFVSVWDNGSIRTPAELDTETGEVTTESVDADGMEHLIEEWFEDNEDGEEYDVCPECHSFILKTIMDEGVGKTLFERQICTDPDCENQ
jgi:hypothetical protein